MNWGKMLNWRN